MSDAERKVYIMYELVTINGDKVKLPEIKALNAAKVLGVVSCEEAAQAIVQSYCPNKEGDHICYEEYVLDKMFPLCAKEEEKEL